MKLIYIVLFILWYSSLLVAPTHSYNYFSFNIQKFNDNVPILINKWVQHIGDKGPYVTFLENEETLVHWLLPKHSNIILKTNIGDLNDFGYPNSCKGQHDTCTELTTEEFTHYSYIFPKNIVTNLIIESMQQEIILYGVNQETPTIYYDLISQCTDKGYKTYLESIRAKKNRRSHRIFTRGFQRRRRLLELINYKKINIHTGFLGTTYIEDDSDDKDFFKVRENTPIIIDATDASEMNTYAILTPNGNTKHVIKGGEQYKIDPPIIRGTWIINEINTWFHVSYSFNVLRRTEYMNSLYLINSNNISLIDFDPAIHEYNISHRKISNRMIIKSNFEGGFVLAVNATLFTLTSNKPLEFNLHDVTTLHVGAATSKYSINIINQRQMRQHSSKFILKNNHVCPHQSNDCGDDKQSHYKEFIDGNERIVRTNGIPNHEYHVFPVASESPFDIDHAQNPNNVCVYNQEIKLPINPTKETTFQATNMGAVGILRTGALLYNHLSNPTGNDDIAYYKHGEGPTLDTCLGHADPCNHYHYHALSKDNTCSYCGVWKPCKQIGWMRDGFPIYSQCSKDNVFLTSCYHLKEIFSPQTFKIDNEGTNGFTFENMPNNNPEILLIKGQTYTFERTSASHPLRIVKEADITLIANTLPVQRTIEIPDSFGLGDAVLNSPLTWTPDTLGVYYYICTVNSHTRMIGKIIVEPVTEIGDDSTDYYFVQDKNNCDLDEANGLDFTGKGYVDERGVDITGYAYVMSDDYPYVMIKYAGTPEDITTTTIQIPPNCPCVSAPLEKCGQNPDGSHFKYPCADHLAAINGICSDGCPESCTLCDTVDINSVDYSTNGYDFPSCEMNYDATNKNEPCAVGKPDFRGLCGDGCLQKCTECKKSSLPLCDDEQMPCKTTGETPKCENTLEIASYSLECLEQKTPLCDNDKCAPLCLERTCESCEHTYSYLEFKIKNQVINSITTGAILKTNGMAIHPIEPYDTDTNGGWIDSNVDLSLLGYADKTFVKNKNSCPLCSAFHLPDHVEKGTILWKLSPNSDVGISILTGVYIYNTVNKNSEIEFFLEGDSLDKCMGHPSNNCVYHYSAYPTCLEIPNCSLFGYMYDGIPILANCVINNVELASCYSKPSSAILETDYTYQKTTSCHLDEANGYAFTEQEAQDLNIQYIKNLNNNRINNQFRPFYAYIINKNEPLYLPGFYGTVWGKQEQCPFKYGKHTIEEECIEIKPLCLDLVQQIPDGCTCTGDNEVCIQTTKEKGIEYYKNSNIPQLSSPEFHNGDDFTTHIHSNSKVEFKITSNRELNEEDSAIFIYFSSSAGEIHTMEFKSLVKLSETQHQYSWEKNIQPINSYAAHDMVETLHIHSSSIVYDKLTNNQNENVSLNVPTLTYENKCSEPVETSGYDLSNCQASSPISLSDCNLNQCQISASSGEEISVQCVEEGGVFIFSGCLQRCTLPDDTTGYDTTNCDTTSHSISINHCNISCLTGYHDDTPHATCVNTVFQLQGCSPACNALGFDEKYYDTTSCFPQDCTLICQENYGGRPDPLTCPSADSPWELDTHNGAIPCTEMCILPNVVEGYNIENVDIEETITGYGGSIVKKTTKLNLIGIECSDGYIGTPEVLCEATNNEIFSFTGCTKACYINSIDTNAYDTTSCVFQDNVLFKEEDCELSCASGYDACTPDTTFEPYSNGNSKCITSNSPNPLIINTTCPGPNDNIKTNYECKPICTLDLTVSEKTDIYDLHKCDSDEMPYYGSPLTVDNCHLGCKVGYVNIKSGTASHFNLTCDTPNGIFQLNDNKCSRLCNIDTTLHASGYDVTECMHYDIGGIHKDVKENCAITCLDDYIEDVDGISVFCDQTGSNNDMIISGCIPKNCDNSPTEIICDDDISCTVDVCLKDGDTLPSGSGIWNHGNPGCYHVYDHNTCDDGYTCSTDTCHPYKTSTASRNFPDSDMTSGCVKEKVNTVCASSKQCVVDEECLPPNWDVMSCSGDDAKCIKDETTGCIQHLWDPYCSDLSNKCISKKCQPLATEAQADGCIYTPLPCTDTGDCGNSECDPAVGCIYTPDNTKCNDNYDCTEDTCESDLTCLYTQDDTVCDDNKGCTVDECIANSLPSSDVVASGCEWTPSDNFCNNLINNAACTFGECKPNMGNSDANGCFWNHDDGECNDDVSCTTDSCDPFDNRANSSSGCVNDYICDATLGDECTLELERSNGRFLKPWTCIQNFKTFSNCVYVQITIIERDMDQISGTLQAEAEEQSELLESNDPSNPCLPNPCVGSGSKCIRILKQEVCIENVVDGTVECENQTVNTYKCNCTNGLTGTNCLLQSVKDSFDVPFEYTLYVVLSVVGLCVCNTLVIGGCDIFKSCDKAAEKARESLNRAKAKYKRKQSDVTSTGISNDIETPLVNSNIGGSMKKSNKKILHF
jgi:plastocyanin